ncbi:beta strand repeat-containing protein [Novosphingobium olei]|uniref:Calcium-binding protein n=1 Tax=Novosphingobium olei TaxID=2728851 RepID=A0A7Y0BTI6_9SPHN|nr:calcium-binding protein [Novosphingobium olei]NML96168.1 calcium-binding protein [Novosphingobium olei]
MGTYNGTNANDGFVGTAASDVFNFNSNVLGDDQADGANGIDTLNINYDALSGGSYSSYISGSSNWSGIIYGSFADRVIFSNMEKLNITLSKADDYLSVSAAPLATAGNTLSLNGGVGSDTLAIDFSALSGTTFKDNGSGTVTSNRGTYAGWETYNITLGAGTNAVTTAGGGDTVSASSGGANTIATGAGNDTINSVGGADKVDGGADFDTWNGNYSAATSALTFAYNGSTGAGTLTGGTTLAGIEAVSLTTGSGNDSLTLTGFTQGYSYVDAGAGTDTLTINDAGQTGAYYGNIYADDAGGFQVYVYNGNGSYRQFTHVEKLAITFSDDDNYLSVSAAPLATAGNTLSLNGGVGSDTLTIDFSALSGTTFKDNGSGTVTSNRGTYAGWETYNITLGAGTNAVTTAGGGDTVSASSGGANTIATGAGNDTINSVGGADKVDGGADFDTWNGNYSAATSALTFAYNGSTGAGTLTGGTTLAGIEAVSLTTGSGNDSLTLTGFTQGYSYVDAGAGTDTLTINDAGQTGAYYYSNIYADDAGGFQVYVYNGNGSYRQFTHVEKLAITFSDDDNYLSVSAAPLATAGNTLSLNGGVGSDTLTIDFSALSGTTFKDNGSGTVTSNRGTYAGWETYNITLGAGTNAVTTAGGGDTVSASSGGANTIATGAGNDTINSVGGADKVDGGADFDTWNGNYSAATSALTFAYNGSTGAGTLTGGTTLAGIEAVSLTTGSGNDSLTLTGFTQGYSYVDAGAGTDTLTINDAGQTGAYYGNIYADDAGGFVTYVNNANGSYRQFTHVEKLAITFSDDDNYLGVDAAASLNGNTLNVDGGVGDDTLRVTGNLSGYSVVQDGLGGYIITDTNVADGDHGSFTAIRFEHLQFDDQAIDLPVYAAGSVYVGTPGDDTKSGSAADDTMSGLGGNDKLSGLGGNDTINGGAGNDVLDGGDGSDTVTYEDATAAVTVSLAVSSAQATGGSGSDTVTNFENLTGSAFADKLTGNAGNNVLRGLAGNDALNGGLGADTMIGGLGDDSYTVDNLGDIVTESANEGTDTVSAIISYALGANVEKLTLTGSAAIDGMGNDLNNTINGNAAANHLYGYGGNDTLDGKAGADIMEGGTGNDTYTVDNAGDIIVENAGEGTDTVKVNFTYSLLNTNLENLTLGGSTAVDGTGNDANNTLTGNAANNTLTGLGGNDKLDGKAGADTMIGGLGNDSYVVDNIGDVVIENAGEGTDTVTASISYTLGSNVEKLTLSGTLAIDGIGNALSNTLTGNAAANILSGLGGNDTLSGGLGNDVLKGGAGADSLTGGGGADQFVFDILETPASFDTIKDFEHGIDDIVISKAAFSAFAADPTGAINANEFVIGTAATTSAQHLVYNQTTGALFYDADGVGGQAQIQIALLSTKPVLDSADFLLI